MISCIIFLTAIHNGVFSDAGFTDVRYYRYFKPSTKGLDIDGMLEDLRQAPERAVVIFHACAHNPTGVDPTKEEWHRIIEVVKVSSLLLADKQQCIILASLSSPLFLMHPLSSPLLLSRSPLPLCAPGEKYFPIL